MNHLSRRDLLKASAGAAAVAVPMVALSGAPANASAIDVDDVDLDDAAPTGREPVMFCVHDAAQGEVSILHGTSEVIVQDRRLVARIMKAANVRQDR